MLSGASVSDPDANQVEYERKVQLIRDGFARFFQAKSTTRLGILLAGFLLISLLISIGQGIEWVESIVVLLFVLLFCYFIYAWCMGISEAKTNSHDDRGDT